jgi:RNA polymerase sigma-70 factor (ECF subfamily)
MTLECEELGAETAVTATGAGGLMNLATRARASVADHDMRDIRDSLQGDGNAYARLIGRYQTKVATRMWRFTGDERDHEELVQEVFVQAFKSLAGYRGEAPFEHWLAVISTRVGYRFWRNLSRERLTHWVPIEDLDQLTFTEPHEIDPKWAADILHRLMDRLPHRDRLVLLLRYVEEYSVQETADLTGWTQTMVKVQAWRARKKLKKLFQESGLEV